MEKFWEWMKDKHYIIREFVDNKNYMIKYLDADRYVLLYPTKQMLIGYMLEYIQELYDKLPNDNDFREFYWNDVFLFCNDQYKDCIEIIKELELILDTKSN